MNERIDELKEKLNTLKIVSAPKLQEQEIKLIDETKNIQRAIESKEKDLANLLPQEKKPRTALQTSGIFQRQEEEARTERTSPSPPRHRR